MALADMLKKALNLIDFPSISKSIQLEDEEDCITVIYWHKRKPYMVAQLGYCDSDTGVRAYKYTAEVSTISPVHMEVEDDGFFYKVAACVDYVKTTDKELEEGAAKVRAAVTESVQLIEKIETITDEYIEKLKAAVEA